MAIDNVGWTIRPNPVKNDNQRRQQQKRKPAKPKQPPRDSGKRQGRIDELA